MPSGPVTRPWTKTTERVDLASRSAGRRALEYVVRVYELGLDDLRKKLRNEGHYQLEAIVETIAETLLEQGEARGFTKGRAEGKAESLLRLTRKKFGEVPEARVDEIQSADADALERWLEALLVAETLEDVFDPRTRH